MKKASITAELEHLRTRLEEAEETLEAIRRGEVDALVVSGPHGDQVYTLRGADHPYRLLLQEMNEGAATLMPDGTVLYCNTRFAAMLKIPLEKVIGSVVDNLVGRTDSPLFEALLEKGKKERAAAEITFALADGSHVAVYCSVSPVDIDDIHCRCLVTTDLTEQKRNEEILAAEKLARSILEQAADVIVVCDEDGVITHSSRAAHELSGTNVLHQPFESVFSLISRNGPTVHCSTDEADSRNGSFIAACLGGRTVQGMEVEYQRPDGKKFDLLMSAGPLRDSQQQPRGCVFTLTDITRLKQAEEGLRQTEQRLRQQAQELEQQLIASGRLVSLGEITASMAHEFNNPLGIAMGFAQELLSEADRSSANYKALNIIYTETKRCEKIIKDLLQFARPSEAAFGPTEVRRVIEETIQLVDNHFYKQKIEAGVLIEENLPSIHADRQQLQQVLVNLYLNAIDAMPEGGALTVEARLGAAAPGTPGEAIVSVADTGFGIGPEDLPKIFQPFFTAKKKTGLGLGLSICQRIIKNHGGRIEVESRPAQGTTFRIYLPLEERADEKTSQELGE